jgi:cytochrome c peroxidase
MYPWFLLLSLALAASAQITPAPNGPYHVEGNKILDATGREFLIRGTTLPPLTLDPQAGFGPFSRTTLITLRQRMNMNAIRIPIDGEAYRSNPKYREFLQDLVKKANQQELLAIIESAAPAQDLKSNPNIFFAVPNATEASEIRSTGATQPIITSSVCPVGRVPDPPSSRSPNQPSPPKPNPDCKGGDPIPNLIQEIPLSYNSPLDLNLTLPLLATGLDPDLTHTSPACAAFPPDPSSAAQKLENLLTTLDQDHINWTISAMEPGKLVNNYSGYDWTKLDDGYTCGAPFSGAGIGMTLLAHLWHADPHGIFTVNQPAGGQVIARGANASAYGRILADRETLANSFKLSNISINVTDSRGVTRPAPLSWTGAGWSSTNLLIPEKSAPGPAEVTVVRTDGSKTTSRIVIANAAPGLWTTTYDGRGPADCQAFQRGAKFPCSKPIPLSANVPTTLRLEGTGFRYATAVKVFIDGMEMPLQSYGPEPNSSRDQATIKVPDTLIARGEVDVQLIADKHLSNIVRITCGGVPQLTPKVPPQLPPPVISKVGQALPPVNARATGGTPKIQLGRYLFYDKRISVNSTTSCATCHHQDLAFTDGRAQALGATGQLHPRSAMSLINLSDATAFNWNDPSVLSLEQQALKPMRSTNPVELGLNEESFLKLISKDETYRPLFRQAFPQEPNPYSIANVTKAIAAFERTIKSTDSPWDRFHRDGEDAAISESAKRGEILFFLDGGPSCFRCHNGPNFTDFAYHNNGLGVEGKFKTPTLRNIAVTAPYMHDGSIATLEKVVEHYATGGKSGHDQIMRGFQMNPQNRTDLVEFLKSLTDENLLHNPRYSNPWP